MKYRSSFRFWPISLIIVSFFSFCSFINADARLTVEANRGRIKLDGDYYRGIGVNYYDAFLRRLSNNSDTSYRAGLKKLGDHDIPFVRMTVTPYWPSQLKPYIRVSNGKYAFNVTFLNYLDDFMNHARKNDVGVVMSLFWHEIIIPDLVGEPISKWGTPNSETRKCMADLTKQIVGRYKDHKATWGWEFGNEMNLKVNLPSPKFSINTKLGTPSSRSSADYIDSKIMNSALVGFLNAVRSIDATGFVSSGNTVPRPGAHHLHSTGNWGQDTKANWRNRLLNETPAAYKTTSVHTYPKFFFTERSNNPKNYFADQQQSYLQWLRFIAQSARNNDRALFIGEFGARDGSFTLKGGKKQTLSLADQKEYMNQLLDAFAIEAIPLAAVWVYDRKNVSDLHNMTFDNSRAWVLQRIKAYNRAISFKGFKNIINNQSNRPLRPVKNNKQQNTPIEQLVWGSWANKWRFWTPYNWEFSRNKDGYLNIINKLTGRALVPRGSSVNAGVDIVQHLPANRYWPFWDAYEWVILPSYDNNHLYNIMNLKSNRMFRPKGGSTKNNVKMSQDSDTTWRDPGLRTWNGFKFRIVNP